MDFVKREDQSLLDEENYKEYMDNLQKSHQIDPAEYQHTQISMEQLHQAMQSSLNGSLVHNFQLPLSPRQMSTLMLKTNLHSFNEIPAHFRNLELNFAQNLSDQVLRHEEMTQNLNRNIDISLVRMGNEIDLQNNLNHSITQNLSEDLRLSDIQLSQLRSDLPHDLSHEIDLSHLNRQNLEQEMIQDEARRMVIQCAPENVMEQNLGQIGHRIDQVRGMEHRLVNIALDRAAPALPPAAPAAPALFHIKAEQEEEPYYYDNMGQLNVNGINGQVEHPHTTHADTQMYSIYPPQTIPALNPIDLYSRQNYQLFSRDNPQNLVMHRQYDTSPYTEKIAREESKEKVEEPKENLKPNDNKIFYNDFTEKEEGSKLTEELSLGIKGEYICYKCNEVCPSKRVLKQHAKACQGKEETVDKYSKFGCSQCPYKCQSPAILKIHERTHSGEKPFSCNFCDYKSGQKNNVAKHILVHMKEKPFRCQYCEYRCAQKNNLVVHERTHTGYKPFACPYCEYRTVQKPNLVKHMYLHTDQKPYSCDVCSYKCVQKTNLTKHKQRHLNETATGNVTVTDKVKPYRPRQKSLKCPHCPYRCVQKSSMEKHLQFKHNIEFVSIDSHEDESVQNLSVKKDFVKDKVCEKSEEIMS